MNSYPISSRLLWLCAALSIATGCQSSKSSSVTNQPDRAAGTDPVDITLSLAPAAWESLGHGYTVFEGSIQSQYGLDESNPETLVMRVRSLDTGHEVEADLNQLLADAPNSSFDYQTGAFRLDFTLDKRLQEGPLVVELIATDAEENTDRWKQPVIAEPQFDNWSEALEAESRQRYGIQILPVVTVYGEFLRRAIESGRLDGTVFPYQDYDLQLQQKLEDIYLETLIARPHTGGWTEIADGLLVWVEELNAEGSPHSPAEQAYRSSISEGLVGSCSQFYFPAHSYWANMIGTATIGSTTAPDSFLWTEAFYRNTFGTAEISEDTDSLTYSAMIRVNTGTVAPTGCCWPSGPFHEPTANTWETNDPVFEMTVELIDTDSDGLYDDLTYNGTLLMDGSTTPEDFEDVIVASSPGLPHYNHLITPLAAIEYSDYWWF